MKAGIIIWSLGTLLATGASYAYDSAVRLMEANENVQETGQYCARMRDGKMIVLFEGKVITGDVFLKNGSTIKPDGTVITKDGVRVQLKEGQCIDINGSIIGESMKKPY